MKFEMEIPHGQNELFGIFFTVCVINLLIASLLLKVFLYELLSFVNAYLRKLTFYYYSSVLTHSFFNPIEVWLLREG